MAIEGSKKNVSPAMPARIRLGMVGGGEGAFIGAVHRIAARLDDQYEFVAGALSSDPENAALSAAEIGIAADRSYADYREMARAEAAGPYSPGGCTADGLTSAISATRIACAVAGGLRNSPKPFSVSTGASVACSSAISAT